MVGLGSDLAIVSRQKMRQCACLKTICVVLRQKSRQLRQSGDKTCLKTNVQTVQKKGDTVETNVDTVQTKVETVSRQNKGVYFYSYLLVVF